MPSRISSFRAVIDLWGKREIMAEDLGVDPEMVAKWRQRDRIPARWWAAVVASPVAKSAGLSAGDLALLAAREVRA